MTPDEQEAESFKYGNEIVLVLVLKSGRYAVFNNQRKLSEIVEDVRHMPYRLVKAIDECIPCEERKVTDLEEKKAELNAILGDMTDVINNL